MDATLDLDSPTAVIIHGGDRENTEEPFETKLIDKTLDPDSPKRIILYPTTEETEDRVFSCAGSTKG